MKNTCQRFTKSRGVFRCLVILASAAAVMTNVSVKRAQAQSPSTDNFAEKADFGLRPTLTTGPVIVPLAQQTFVTFDAELDGGSGACKALVALDGCLSWRLRRVESEDFTFHRSAANAFEACEIYEIKNSTWLSSAEAAAGGAKTKFRHFVITFDGFLPGICAGSTDFECLAEDLIVDFSTVASFEELLEIMKAQAAGTAGGKRASTRK